MIDYFISYTSANERWAEWIGWILEDEGFSVKLQAWDFAAGSNFVLEMQRVAEQASRTIAVLSPAYLKSTFAAPEWAAAFAKDPEGFKRSLVPVRVEACEPGGLLKTIVHIDLLGLEEDEARERLLDRLSGGRAKPSKRPRFPGSAQPTQRKDHVPFPGLAASAGSSTRTPARFIPTIRRSPTDLEKRRFIQTCFDTLVRHFKETLGELSAQDGAIEGELKEINATKYVAEIFVNGEKRAHCKFWLGDRMVGDGIAYSETDFGWEDNSFNEMLSLARDELALKPLMGDFGGRAGEGLNVEHLTPEEAAEFLWRRFTSRLS
jgi:TIR domain